MTRETSIETYNAIKREGLLSKRRWEAYNLLFQHGPMTANELMDVAERTKQANHIVMETLSKRMSELRKMGAIKEVGERSCKITGRNCIEWDVTKNKPTKYNPPETNTHKIIRLEKELIYLKASLCPKCRSMELFQ